MADITTLSIVCNLIDAQLQNIYEHKLDYSVGNTPTFNLNSENFAAYNALYQLKLHLEKAIESHIDAMESEYGE